MMPWGITKWIPDDALGHHFGHRQIRRMVMVIFSIHHRVFFWSKNIFIVPSYTFNDCLDLAICIFLCLYRDIISIYMFVKLIQEYRGGANFIQVIKGY